MTEGHSEHMGRNVHLAERGPLKYRRGAGEMDQCVLLYTSEVPRLNLYH